MMSRFMMMIFFPILKHVGRKTLIELLKYAIRILEKDQTSDIRLSDVEALDKRLDSPVKPDEEINVQHS